MPVGLRAGEGPIADMRVLRLAKESAVKARKQAKNQLKAVLVGVDPALREARPQLSSSAVRSAALIARCANLPDARSRPSSRSGCWPGVSSS